MKRNYLYWIIGTGICMIVSFTILSSIKEMFEYDKLIGIIWAMGFSSYYLLDHIRTKKEKENGK